MIRSSLGFGNNIVKLSRCCNLYNPSSTRKTQCLLFSSSHHNTHSGDSNSDGDEKNNWRRNGTPELLFGFTILILLGVDHFLQREQEQTRLDLKNQMRTLVREDQKSEYESNQQNHDQHKTASALFQCKIRRVPPEYFDGYKCLSSHLIQVGDVVDVLEEQVGPDKMYHLCRTTTTTTTLKKEKQKEDDKDNESVLIQHIGWFPTSCLEKLD